MTLEPKDYDKIIPFFVVRELPAGISGLVIAAIFAAAMSSFDSGLNSIVTSFTVDWYERLIKPGQSDRKYLVLAKALSLVIGAAVTILAILIYQTGFKSIIDESNRYLGFFGGALLGLFMLGVFTRRAKALPTLLGGIVSVALVILLDRYNTSSDGGISYRFVHPWMYLLVSCGVTMVLGYVGSLFGPELPFERVRELTVARSPRPNDQRAPTPGADE
jgi:Na+/proline symporter